MKDTVEGLQHLSGLGAVTEQMKWNYYEKFANVP